MCSYVIIRTAFIGWYLTRLNKVFKWRKPFKWNYSTYAIVLLNYEVRTHHSFTKYCSMYQLLNHNYLSLMITHFLLQLVILSLSKYLMSLHGVQGTEYGLVTPHYQDRYISKRGERWGLGGGVVEKALNAQMWDSKLSPSIICAREMLWFCLSLINTSLKN